MAVCVPVAPVPEAGSYCVVLKPPAVLLLIAASPAALLPVVVSLIVGSGFLGTFTSANGQEHNA